MSATPIGQRLEPLVPTLSVGVLTADLAQLAAEVGLLADTGVQLVHFDVMDGVFCPMMTFGSPLVAALQTPLLKDVHLMIQDPLEKVAAYVDAGADLISVHVESDRHIHRVLQKLGTMENRNDPDRGLIRGAALNPGTPVDALEPLLDELEMILLLAVNPGWGGQAWIASTGRRLAQARQLISASGRRIFLAVDGGVKHHNVTRIGAMGADLIVAGSAVFDGKAPQRNARSMLAALHPTTR